MHDFFPAEIYLDQSVADSPVAKRVLSRFPALPVTTVADRRDLKIPEEHTRAKRRLYLAEYRGDPLKSCQGMGDYVCCQYFTIALVSDCHLECTYCILQDYLKNNPLITVYANTADIFARVRERTDRQTDRTFRIGTGELSDSLSLDHITGFSADVVAFARSTPNVVMELKTKTANIANLIGLDHGGRTVVSWSLNPQSYIDSDEHKCDTLSARLSAARRCADAGYPVAFHFDPLIAFEDWREQYDGLIRAVAERFKPGEIAWTSIGSLRFTRELKKISRERFPRSAIMTGEFIPSRDGKLRYFRPIREEMYGAIKGWIEERLGTTPHYLCMETKAVWQNVYGAIPPSNTHLEKHLAGRFAGNPPATFTV